MFKYTKRLLSDVRFRCRELKLRSKENAELDRIEEDALIGKNHSMAGLGYYITIRHNRAKRKEQHYQERA